MTYLSEQKYKEAILDKCFLVRSRADLSVLATSHPECLSANDELISTFLKFADLAKFEAFKGLVCTNLTIWMMFKLKIYPSLVILSSYVDWFCFVFLFDTDNIETGSSFIISHGTTTVLFIGLTDIEIRQFTRKKEEFGLKYSMAIHLAI